MHVQAPVGRKVQYFLVEHLAEGCHCDNLWLPRCQLGQGLPCTDRFRLVRGKVVLIRHAPDRRSHQAPPATTWPIRLCDDADDLESVVESGQHRDNELRCSHKHYAYHNEPYSITSRFGRQMFLRSRRHLAWAESQVGIDTSWALSDQTRSNTGSLNHCQIRVTVDGRGRHLSAGRVSIQCRVWTCSRPSRHYVDIVS